MASSMYKLVQTINSTKFRIEPFEEYYDVFEEIGRWERDLIAENFEIVKHSLKTLMKIDFQKSMVDGFHL